MTITEWCDNCGNSWKCDDENTPDCCPYCGYDGQDYTTAKEPEVYDYEPDERGDEAAEFGGMDIPDSRY